MNDDLISRAAATTIPILPIEHRKYQTMNIDDAYDLGWLDCQNCIEKLPPAEPERNGLTKDDIETIRIHLSAIKENLCNQRRWKEAQEYEDLIKRLLSASSAQPERDIPMKPNETIDSSWGIRKKQAVCPKCDYYLGHVEFIGNPNGKKVTYCETCGQAIDWEGWKWEE